MRIAFFGTGPFSVTALRQMAPHVVVVVSQPDRPTGRGSRLAASPVKSEAIALGIPVETPEKSRSPEFVEKLRQLDLDFLLVASYGQILSQAVLDSARFGGINLHGSLLPKYRGAAPIQRAIQAGESETGITLMQMDKGMDTGDIIAAETVPIDRDETYGELQDRLAEVASRMIVDWAPRIVAGDYPRAKQNSEEASMAPKLEKSEGNISPSEDASAAYNRFRAFTPQPGATLMSPSGRVKLLEAKLDRNANGVPGVLLDGEGLVAFKNGAIRILQAVPEGKRAMAARDWINGMRVKPGNPVIIPFAE